MTPPFRSFGLPRPGRLSLSVEQAHGFQPTPAFQAMARSILSSQTVFSNQGRNALSRSVPSCNDAAPCLNDHLPEAVRLSLAAAEQNPGLYRINLYFLAAQFHGTEDQAVRSGIQNQARSIARTALDQISNPEFTPAAETPGESPLRSRTRLLFNIVSTLSALLAQPSAEAYSAEDRALMREYFVRIQTFIGQLHENHRLDSSVIDWPEYFGHYINAQVALIDGQSTTAFSELLRTRQLLNMIPEAARNLPMPTQLRASTEMALQSLPHRGTGAQVEGLRNLISIEALGFIDQSQYLQSNGESSAAQAQRRSQALSLVAATYLQAGNASINATALLEHLAAEGNTPSLRQILEERLSSDTELSHGIASLFPGDLSNSETRQRVADAILNLARSSASSILSHANEQPYRTVFTHDVIERPIALAIESLNGNAALLGALRSAFSLEADASAEAVTRELVSYGENLPALLATLPQELRDASANRPFFQSLTQAGLGYDGDGMRLNLEMPLLDMVESLNDLARSDDTHAAAYFAIFDMVNHLEHVGPDAQLPASLRRIAGTHASALQNFSGERVLRHLTAPSSLGMMAAGIALSELAPIWLLRGARIPLLRSREAAAAVASTGEMGSLVRGGQLTWRGHAVAGLGVGLAMHLGSIGAHVVSARGTRFSEYGQELRNIGLSNLAWGTLFSMAALAGTMGLGSVVQRRLLPEGVALSGSRLALGHVGLRLSNWTIGGGLMLGAHSATAAISGHSARPTGEQAAEVFISMAMWDAGAAGLRASLPRLFSRYGALQAGPFRVEQMVRSRTARVIELNPSLNGNRSAIEQYLRVQSRDWTAFNRIETELNRGMIPSYNEGRAGGELTFAPAPARARSSRGRGGPPPLPATPAANSRNEAALHLTSLSPTDASLVLQISRSAALHDSENPVSIHVVRQVVRQRLEAGEADPIAWGRVRRDGRNISFEHHSEAPRESDREGTFQMGMNGKIFELQTEDPVLRGLLLGFYNTDMNLSAPIAAAAPAPVTETSENQTVVGRRNPPREDVSPAATPEAATPIEAAPTPVESSPASSAPSEEAPAEVPASPANDSESGDDSTTGPFTGGRRRRQTGERGDATVTYSTSQEREARIASARSDSNEEATGSRDSQPEGPESVAPRSSEETEEPVNLDDDVDFILDPESEAEAIPLVLRMPTSGVPTSPMPPPLPPSAPRPETDLRVTLRPEPGDPAQIAAQEAALLSAGDAAMRRGTESTAVFREMVERIKAASPITSEDVTVAARTNYAGIAGYEVFAKSAIRFVTRLPILIRAVPREITTFHIRVNADNGMELVDGNLYQQEESLSYFRLQRYFEDDRAKYYVDDISLIPFHRDGGWEAYITKAWPPSELIHR